MIIKQLPLQLFLEELLGSENVYFQPPMSLVMEYPAIVYKVDSAEGVYANNNGYLFKVRYLVTYIDYDPDSPMVEKLLLLPFCSFKNAYAKNNLNHVVFSLYF